MQQFRIGETGFKKIRRKILTVSLPIMIVVAGIITYTSTANKPAGENDPTTTLIMVAAIVLFFGWTIFNLFRKQKKALLDYCVTITDDEISLQQQKNHKITISFMEIKEIIKTAKGHYIVKGEGEGNQISIPNYVDGYADLESRLQKLGAITVREKDPFYQKYPLLVVLPFIGLIICVYAATNKILVGIAGTVVTGALIWSFYKTLVNKAMPPKTKRMLWFLPLVIISIIYITITKLMA